MGESLGKDLVRGTIDAPGRGGSGIDGKPDRFPTDGLVVVRNTADVPGAVLDRFDVAVFRDTTTLAAGK
jgi:hypothetical protein